MTPFLRLIAAGIIAAPVRGDSGSERAKKAWGRKAKSGRRRKKAANQAARGGENESEGKASAWLPHLCYISALAPGRDGAPPLLILSCWLRLQVTLHCRGCISICACDCNLCLSKRAIVQCLFPHISFDIADIMTRRCSALVHLG